ANFIERDIMTRRIQYRGAVDADWAACGPDVRSIATAFVRGINAWIAIARERVPEEFVLAGWRPDAWTPEDLLSRTDAFLAADNAREEVLRSRIVAAVGARRGDRLLPATQPSVVPAGLDPSAVSYVVGEALKRAGTPPFFMGLAAPAAASRAGASNAWAIDGRKSATGRPMIANDPHPALSNPSPRYLVHLHAPGWNVVGATRPWLPGVAVGHNERIAWAIAGVNLDVQDLYVETVNPANAHQ